MLGFAAPGELSPREPRRALLVEGQDALASIVRRHQPIVGLDLEQHAVGERKLQAVVDRALRLAHRERAVTGDAAGGLGRLAQELVGFAYAVDQAESQRLLGRE